MFEVVQTDEFIQWLSGIRDSMTKRRLITRLRKVSLGQLGDAKPVGEGVFELREHFGPGWRMYFIKKGRFIVVMLGGGDKSSQQADIAKAKILAKSIEE